MVKTMPISRDPQQTPGPRDNAAPVISDHVQFLLKSPAAFPRWELISGLTAEDKQPLLAFYRQTTNLLDRRAVTWALGYVGDEDAIGLFKNALLHEFGGRKLTAGFPDKTDEEYVLFDTVRAMGFLATKYDSAYSFLKQGIDAWFWKDSVKWSSNRGRDTMGLLASYSIQAVGQSGRPDVPEILEALKTTDLINRTGDEDRGARNFSGDVVQSAFYYDIIQKYGMDHFRKNFVGEERERLWNEWKNSENAKQWREWSDATRQIQRANPQPP